MRIDAHHHFWNYNAAEFDWIGGEMSTLRRDFSPAELKWEIAAANFDGTVAVEARQTLEETDWLLQLAREYSWIKGVVGWLPLCDEGIERVLKRYAGEKKLVGARHVVQAEPDGFLARADFNRGIGALKKFDLVYDILIVKRQLPQAIEFVDRHPHQFFVLDHLAKPRIKDGVLQPWRAQMNLLAKRENVFCKLSGLVTEADFQSWTPQALHAYYEVALEAFGAARLIFGSDWPVCLAASEYARWMETVMKWTSTLSTREQAQIFGENATRVYGLAA